MTYVVLKGENGPVVARGLSADKAEQVARKVGRYGAPNQPSATYVREDIYDNPKLWPPVIQH